MKIFPLKDAKGKIGWFSQGDDNIPVETDTQEWMFVKMSLSYANELVQTGRWTDLSDFYTKVRKYQRKNGGATLPSDTRFKAEKTYNTVSNARPLAITLMCVGLVAFFSFCLLSARGGPPPPGARFAQTPKRLAAGEINILIIDRLLSVFRA